MYDICGARNDGKLLNCPFGSPAVKAVPFLVGCPTCLRNFLNIFCELSCSPNPSLFINATSASKVKNNFTVDGIDFYLVDSFGEGLFKSCKDVKFGIINTRAIEFTGVGAKNFREWYAFFGKRAEPSLLGSPYAIDFRSGDDESSRMKLMNVTAYSCSDTSLGCSCGDCDSSTVFPNSAPSLTQKIGSCSVRIRSLKMLEDAPQITNRVQLSIVQGYM